MVKESFSASIGALRDVTSFLEDHLSTYLVPKKVKQLICIATEEIFVNIADYAYPDGEGFVTLELCCEEGVLTLWIKDSGIPFDPLQLSEPDITASIEERPIGGLGIYLTRKCMDEVSYSHENGQNILTLKKNFEPERQSQDSI